MGNTYLLSILMELKDLIVKNYRRSLRMQSY